MHHHCTYHTPYWTDIGTVYSSLVPRPSRTLFGEGLGTRLGLLMMISLQLTLPLHPIKMLTVLTPEPHMHSCSGFASHEGPLRPTLQEKASRLFARHHVSTTCLCDITACDHVIRLPLLYLDTASDQTLGVGMVWLTKAFGRCGLVILNKLECIH